MAEAIQQPEEVVEPINFCCDASKEQDGNGNVLDLLSEAVGYTVYDNVLLENGEPCDCEENLKRKELRESLHADPEIDTSKADMSGDPESEFGGAVLFADDNPNNKVEEESVEEE